MVMLVEPITEEQIAALPSYEWDVARVGDQAPLFTYRVTAESIREGGPAHPSFAAAVTRHRLLDAIVQASETGQKQVL